MTATTTKTNDAGHTVWTKDKEAELDRLLKLRERSFDALPVLEQSARQGTLEWFTHTIEVHERAIQDLKGYRERFVEAFDAHLDSGHATPQDVLGWATGCVRNAVSNVRLDLAVARGAELAVVHYLRRRRAAK